MIDFLKANVLPEGVHAIPVHSVEWLIASIDCGKEGTLAIVNSKTDYVFLLDRGKCILDEYMKEREAKKITEESLMLVLNHIIVLLETKTTKGLGNGEGPMHQGVLEYLAVNKLRPNTSGEHARSG